MSNYDDIINLPRWNPDSIKHPRMTIYNRSAQFAPFAALTGFEEAVDETARLTTPKIELNQEQIEELNKNIAYLKKHLSEHPQITVTYFREDLEKPGGSYITRADCIQNINDFERKLHLISGLKIPIENIFSIEIQHKEV
ncbi:MAG: hypothetical protein Q4E88_01465 [Coriobacteriia bacterium]|nr:hypothetical protein [Coriobacteriia bacterium]